MYCPRCQTLCGNSDRYCPVCGYQLQPAKKKHGSRRFPLLLLILMSVCGIILFFVTTGNRATDASCPWFYINNGTLYFDADRYTGGSELSIPSEICGQTVTALGEDCFAGCDTITTIFLPDTIATIGDGAFRGCSGLRGIYLPSSVCSIGKEAFFDCCALESICLHSGVTCIGSSAFDRCDHLGYIIFRGNYAQWIQLYDAPINPNVGVFCKDGSFFQGEDHTR